MPDGTTGAGRDGDRHRRREADRSGTIETTASVSAAEADPTPENNTAIESTTVQSSVDIALPSQSERTAQLGVEYALSLNATGGTPPYTWSQIGGVLPPGMTLNSETGASRARRK